MAESFIQLNSGSGGPKAHTNNRTIGANSVEDEVMLLGENYLAGYSVFTGAISTATANSHILQIMAGGSLKVRIRRIVVHQYGLATAATLMDLRIVRLTTAGTGGTVLTNQAFDLTDAASGASSMSLPTVKGTDTVNFSFSRPYMMQTLAASSNLQQPIQTWDFDRPRSKPLIISAGAANGIAVKNVDAVAGATIVVECWFDETNF
jgi:hypothetical protein